MNNLLTFGTWNLCLGLSNKKDSVIDHLVNNSIDICALQETEIIAGFPERILDCCNFKLELESNEIKKRAGFYIKKDFKYTRRKDLEKDNMHLVIIDVHLDKDLRLINIYRTFRPQDMTSPVTFFKSQLTVIKIALNSNCTVLGDFNLDACIDKPWSFIVV